MSSKNKKRKHTGSEAQYGPRLVGKILHDYLEKSSEPLAIAYRKHKASKLEAEGNHAQHLDAVASRLRENPCNIETTVNR